MKKIIIAVLALTPIFAFAQNLDNIGQLIASIGGIVQIALPIVVGIALLVFFWGLVKFIFAQGNEEAKVEAKKIMLWGIIALFVMVSIWGLVKFIGTALGVNQGDTVIVPTVPGI